MSYPWSELAVNVGASALAVVVLMSVLIVISLRMDDHSLVDIAWGPGFALIAAVSYLASAGSSGDHGRRLTVLLLTALWGLRLGIYLGRRNLGHGQDPRYTAMLRHRQGNLLVFLVTRIYGLQGAMMLLVSLPVQVAMYERRSLGVLGLAGVTVWGLGIVFEAVGDWQLARFKADPDNTGKVMDRGLWAWTRHPNYFGDATVWTGLWILALGHWAGLLTVVAPIGMTLLLTRYSGKTLLERRMLRSKGQAYADYLQRTSGFFPLPPRRRQGHASLDRPHVPVER